MGGRDRPLRRRRRGVPRPGSVAGRTSARRRTQRLRRGSHRAVGGVHGRVRRAACASAPEREAAVAVGEPGGAEPVRDRRVAGRRRRRSASARSCGGARPSGARPARRPTRRRRRRTSAGSARRAPGTPRALRRPAPRTRPPAAPGDPVPRATGARRRTAGRDRSPPGARPCARSPRIGSRKRPDPIDGARHRELRRAEPVDEVAAPDLAGHLQRLQHAVDAREPARHALGQHRLAREHAVTIEQLQRSRVRDLGGARRRLRAAARRATSARRPRAVRSGGARRVAAASPRAGSRATASPSAPGAAPACRS